MTALLEPRLTWESPGHAAEEATRMTLTDFVERERQCGVFMGPYEKTWLLERAPASAQDYMRRAQINPSLFMAAPSFSAQVAGLTAATVSFTAVASTSTETNITFTTSGAAARYAAVAANDPAPGVRYAIHFGGIISNTATPTIIWTPRWGQSDTATSNVTLGASPTITTVASLSNHAVYGVFELMFRSQVVAAAGDTATGNGFVAFGNATATATVAAMGATVATTLTTSTAQGLMASLTWSASSASNTYTTQWLYLERQN